MSQLFFPVKFQSASIGDEIASIGVKVSRDHLTPEVAESALLGQRVTLDVRRGAFTPGQKQIKFDDLPPEEVLRVTVDIKSLSLKPNELGFRLAAAIASVSVPILCDLAKKDGTVVVVEGESIPAPEKPEKSAKSQRTKKVDDHVDTGPILEEPKDEMARVRAMPTFELERFGIPRKGCETFAGTWKTIGEICSFITEHGAGWEAACHIKPKPAAALMAALIKSGAMERPAWHK